MIAVSRDILSARQDFPSEMEATLQLGGSSVWAVPWCWMFAASGNAKSDASIERTASTSLRQSCKFQDFWHCKKWSVFGGILWFERATNHGKLRHQYPSHAPCEVSFPIRSCILVGKDAMVTEGIQGAISGPSKLPGKAGWFMDVYGGLWDVYGMFMVG